MSAARYAATVLVLRPAPTPGDGAVEVLLVRRGRGAPFMADAYVFPGGRVDEGDGAAGSEDASRACALRELVEEVGLRLPGPGALHRFSHWITPSAEPRRFDTAFYLAALPPGQAPVLDEKELTDLLWLTPAEALRRFVAGALKLPPPTLCNLEELAGHLRASGAQGAQGGGEAAVAALLAGCAARATVPILPKLVPAEDGLAIVMPWDPSFPELPGEGAAAPRPPHVRTRRCVATLEGRWRAEE